MPMSTRELYLVLRARDEASRTLRGISRELLATGAAATSAANRANAAAGRAAASAAMRAEADAARAVAAHERMQAATARGIAIQRRNQAAMERGNALLARENAAIARGMATQSRANAVGAQAMVQRERDLAAHQRVLMARAQDHAAVVRSRIALARLNGATGEQIEAMQRQVIGIEQSVRGFRRLAARHDEAARQAMNLVRSHQENARTAMALAQRHQEAARQANAMASGHNEAARRATLLAQQHDAAARAALGLARQHDAAGRAAERAYDQQGRAAEDAARRQRHLISITEQSGQALATAGVGLVAFGAVAIFAMKGFIDVAIEYERQVRHTATQVDGFKGNLQELGDIGRRIANEIALPFEQIQPALFDIFSSTEANMKQAEMLLRAFSKAAVAGQVDVQEASRATIGILNSFGRPLEDVNKILDMQFQLVQEGVGTYQEWAEKLGLVAPSAARAGQSVEVMMAALATATRMGMSAARSTTSVARAFDAISNPKVVDNLAELGIKARTATGNLRPFNEILRDLRGVIMKMPEKDRVGAILEIFKGAGSTIEARRFLQTMLLVPGTLETFDSILGEMKTSTGSLDQAYGLMADTAAAKTQMLHNKWMLLKEGVGQALIPTFISLINGVMKVLDRFNALSPSVQKSIALFLVFSSVIGVVGGVILIVVGAIAAIIAAIVAAGSVLLAVIGGAAALVAVLGLLAGAFIYLWKHSANFRMILAMMWKDLQTVGGIVSGLANQFMTAFREHLLPPLQELWAYIEEFILPAFVSFRSEIQSRLLTGLQEAANVIGGVLVPVMRWVGDLIRDFIIPAVKGLTEKWIENRDKLQPFIDALIFTAKIGAAFIGVIVLLAGAGVLGFLAATFWMIVGVVKIVIGILGWLVDRFNDTKGAVMTAVGVLRVWGQSIQLEVTRVRTIFSNLPDTIRNAVGNMGGVLLNAGYQVIQGLIAGIRNAIPGLGTVLSGVGNYIQEHKGPIEKDRKLLVPAGKAIMAGLMAGIESQLPTLLNQLNGINSTLNLSTGANSDGEPSFRDPRLNPAPVPVVNKYYSITQNITTQEISPQRTATELGWEVMTVM